MMTLEEYKQETIKAIKADLPQGENEKEVERFIKRISEKGADIERCYNADLRELGKPDFQRHIFAFVNVYLIAG